ncbi:MAG: hypothetical protein ACLFRI_04925 [Candidatus Izemoplasmataceae bacterium]
MENLGQLLMIFAFMVIAGIVGYFISFLLSKLHIALIFLIPVFFLSLGGLLLAIGAFDVLNAGLGNLVILIYAMLAFFVAVPNIVSSIILYYKTRKKSKDIS